MLESNNLCGLTPLCDFIIWQYSDHVIPYWVACLPLNSEHRAIHHFL